ncbi:ankyrin repeat-containing domain protein [Tuber borchii]|uniref:Ankyrin repeat-containing domain protein n=1 Tax=Tuber borchii TaxID=42251 RepID=A0A2T6ZSW3_TUBBO|nr:ankyrin repeat-containing domain protein [Tuber borchii]
MPFLHLPSELILAISKHMSPPDLNSLIRVNRHMAILLRASLIDRACDLSYFEHWGVKAIGFAAKLEDKATVRRILGTGRHRQTGVGRTLLLRVIKATRSSTAVRVLLECGVEPGEYDDLALSRAVEWGLGGAVELLLDREDIDVNGLMCCGEQRVPLLVVAVNHPTRSAEVLKILLNHRRIDQQAVNQGDWLIVHRAVCTKNKELLQVLLAHGSFNVNIQDPGIHTPLIVAASGGWEECVRLLLDYPLVNTGMSHGVTALHVAAMDGRDGVIRLLLKDGRFDVNERDAVNGCTPLLLAAEAGAVSAVRALLEHEGIDVNLDNYAGDTPLYVASERAPEIVEMLLAREDICTVRVERWEFSIRIGLVD